MRRSSIFPIFAKTGKIGNFQTSEIRLRRIHSGQASISGFRMPNLRCKWEARGLICALIVGESRIWRISTPPPYFPENLRFLGITFRRPKSNSTGPVWGGNPFQGREGLSSTCVNLLCAPSGGHHALWRARMGVYSRGKSRFFRPNRGSVPMWAPED